MAKNNEQGWGRRLLERSLYYLCAHGIEALLPALLLPFLTRFLTPTELGIWVLYVAIFSFLRPLVGLTLQDALRMRFYELHAEELLRYIVTAISISTVLTIGSLAVVLPFSGGLEELTKFPAGWQWALVVTAYLHGLFYTLLALLQFREEHRSFVIVQMVHTGITLLLCAYVLPAGLGWQGLVAARMAGLVATILFILKLPLAELSFDFGRYFDVAYGRELLAFGARYLPAGIAMAVIPLCDRLALAHMESVAEASYLGIGAMFGMSAHLLAIAFIFAWQPWLFRRLASCTDQDLREIKLASAAFYLGLPLAGIAVVLLSLTFLPLLVGERFLAARPYIVWMVAAGVAQGIFVHNQTYLHFWKKVEWMSLASLVAIISNAVLNVVLIRYVGGIGVAYATAIAFLSAAAVSGCLALKLIRRDRS